MNLIDAFYLSARQHCGRLYFRVNDKKELEAKHRSATAADPQIAAAAAASLGTAASSAGYSELHELKKRNDELEDEVSVLCCLSFESPRGVSCCVALVLYGICSPKKCWKG